MKKPRRLHLRMSHRDMMPFARVAMEKAIQEKMEAEGLSWDGTIDGVALEMRSDRNKKFGFFGLYIPSATIDVYIAQAKMNRVTAEIEVRVFLPVGPEHDASYFTDFEYPLRELHLDSIEERVAFSLFRRVDFLREWKEKELIARVLREADDDCIPPNFHNAAEKEFSFLCKLGFKVVLKEAAVVRYQKDGFIVRIYYDRLSYVIELSFSLEDIDHCGLSAFMACAGVESDEGRRLRATSTKEAVGGELRRLADLTQRYCMPAIAGDREFFLWTVRRGQVAKERKDLEKRLRIACRLAADAFRRRDYRTAVMHYAGLEEELPPVDKAKLSYARKKINDATGA